MWILRSPLWWVLALPSMMGYTSLMLYVDHRLPQWAGALANVGSLAIYACWVAVITLCVDWHQEHRKARKSAPH